jgi:O-antigen ligase
VGYDSSTGLMRASLVLVGLAWVVPFVQPYHRFPLASFYSEWLAFGLGLAAALVLLRRESWRDADVPAIALAPLGLMLLLGLQVALGRVPYPEQALTAALYLSWAVLLLVLARALKRELPIATIAETLAWFTLAGGLLSALAGMLQHYDVISFMVMRKNAPAVYGNLGQPNHYAAYLSMALASAAYLYGRGRLHGALAAACVAWVAIMLALCGSRSTWLYFVALILVAALAHARRRDAATRRIAVFTLCLVPAFAAAQWVASLPLLQPERGALTSLERLFEIASGVAARVQLGGEAWRMFLESPLLGAGFGQFAWHHFASGPPADSAAAPGVFQHAHNIVLHVMAECGLAGALLVAGAGLYWIAGLRGVELDSEWWWLLALLCIIGIHSLLEFPLWYAYFLGMASILLGLGATQVLKLRRAGMFRAVTALALALGWLHLLAIVGSYRDFERLVFETRREEQGAGEREFGARILELHREPLLKPYVELALTFGVVVSESDLTEKLELNARVLRFAPIGLVAYRQALLLAMNGEREAALRQLDLAARAYPHELSGVVPQLGQLARRHPDKFAPLLELAAARSAELRARGAVR